MSPVSSGFVIFGTVTDDPNVLEYLARLAAHIHGEHTAKLARRLDVSSRYLRYMLDGHTTADIDKMAANVAEARANVERAEDQLRKICDRFGYYPKGWTR